MLNEIERTCALAATLLGGIITVNGVLSGDSNQVIIGTGCLMTGMLSQELIGVKDAIQKSGAAIVACLISDKFRKELDKDVKRDLKQSKTEKKK